MVHLGVLYGKKYRDTVKQGTVNFSYKGPDSKYFRLCSPRGKIEDAMLVLVHQFNM